MILKQVTEAVLPLVGAENSGARQIFQILRDLCASCSQKVAG